MDEALTYFQRALAIKPDYAEAHVNLGAVRYAQGKVAEAAASFHHALRYKPDFAEALNNLGGLLVMQGKLSEAVTACERAIALKPDYAEAYCHLGSALAEQGKLNEAVASFERALLLKPDFAEAFSNLCGVQIRQGRLAEAVANCERALAIKPDYAEAHVNLGTAHYGRGQLDEAEGCYDRALLVEPDNGNSHFSRAFLWLLRGQLDKGWEEYEWRWHRPEQPPRSFPKPAWQGEPLAGRTILLHAEQGYGDTLQFIRYAELLKQAGAGGVLLECHHPALMRLLRDGCPGVDKVLALGEPLPLYDVHAPLLSMPRLMGTTSVERIPSGVPYLHFDPHLAQRWRTRLESVPGFRIGIVWQGSPTNKGDHRRSVSVQRFAALSRVPGVSLISLQKGLGIEQISSLPGLVDIGQQLSDFADTAAVLQSLDLVVAVDTALVHLAGALGTPVWMALPFAPDWRWLLKRSDSPWYPSLRLFRQNGPGAWDEVFERITAAVVERVGSGA